jgi:hypothetical protein
MPDTNESRKTGGWRRLRERVFGPTRTPVARVEVRSPLVSREEAIRVGTIAGVLGQDVAQGFGVAHLARATHDALAEAAGEGRTQEPSAKVASSLPKGAHRGTGSA